MFTNFRSALLFIPALALIGCTEIEGSGHVVDEERSVRAFDSLTAGGALHVVATVDATLAPGEHRVIVTTDDNLQRYVTTRVVGGRLTISQDENLDPTADLLVEVHVPRLVDVHCHDASVMELSGVDEAEFHLRVSDASFVDIRGVAGVARVDVDDASAIDGVLAGLASLTLDATDASSIVLAGDASVVDMTASDASTIDTTRLSAGRVRASAADASAVDACAHGEFEQRARDASSVRNECAPMSH